MRREHRVRRRQGEDVPATPTLTQQSEHYQSPLNRLNSSDPIPSRNSTPVPLPRIVGRGRRVTRRVQRHRGPQQQLDQGNQEQSNSNGWRGPTFSSEILTTKTLL
jgi:hypothetical protein